MYTAGVPMKEVSLQKHCIGIAQDIQGALR